MPVSSGQGSTQDDEIESTLLDFPGDFCGGMSGSDLDLSWNAEQLQAMLASGHKSFRVSALVFMIGAIIDNSK